MAYIIQAFEQLGWKFRLKDQFSRGEIAAKLEVEAQHRQLFNRLLEILAQEEIIAPIESDWQVVKIPQQQDTQKFMQRILAEYPCIKAELNLLNRCGQALSQVLQGKRHPLQLIFPQGDLSASTQLYQESPLARLMNTLVQKVISLALPPFPQEVVENLEPKKVRILEIGAETQEILPSWKIEIPYLDFSHTELTEVKEWLANTVQKPFNLSDKPLLRVEIVKLAADLHWLVITIHHIVSDGWSIEVMCEDLGRFYAAQCQGISPQLKLPRQFSDYIQNQQRFQEQLCQDEAYWLEQFSGSIPHLELPTDYPRPQVQTYQGQQQSKIIPASITVSLKNLSHQQGCTLFMTLLTSFNLLLQHLSSQQDLVIGISAAGQLSLGWKDLVGYCVNVLPLRLNFDKTTFLDHLKSVRQVLLKAYEHQNYPYAELLEKLKLKRNPSGTPLISVQFNLDRFGEWLDFDELEVKGTTNFAGVARRDLTWNLTEMRGELILTCTYNTDLFKSETIKHWIKQFESGLPNTWGKM